MSFSLMEAGAMEALKRLLRAVSVMHIYLATNNSHEVAQHTSWIDLGAALLLMRRALVLNLTYTKEDKT